MIYEHNKDIFYSYSRLKWACRRGMLELDVLLGNFLEVAFSTLSFSEQAQFASLLAYSDPELFAWLTGQNRPDDKDLATMVDKIRQTAVLSVG